VLLFAPLRLLRPGQLPPLLLVTLLTSFDEQQFNIIGLRGSPSDINYRLLNLIDIQ